MQSGGEPLLSICIPTYNRAANLRSLFATLLPLKRRFGEDVEFCVSDNASPDETRAVIEEFSRPLGLRVVHQARNIGGTLNIIEVAQLVRGRWGMFLGDDDELVSDALDELLRLLRSCEAAARWILIDAQNIAGRSQYLGGFVAGAYGAARFRRAVVKVGLNTFGFMGVHVFPRAAVGTFRSMTLEDAQPWPHTACMLRETAASNHGVRVLKRAVTIQATDAKLFWKGGDLAKLRLDKVRIVMRICRAMRARYGFFHCLMLRELYAWTTVSALLAWRLYEPEDFDQRAVSTYVRSYGYLGLCAPLAVPHLVLLSIARLIPGRLFARMFRLFGLGYLLSDYQALKTKLGMFDGIKRGI